MIKATKVFQKTYEAIKATNSDGTRKYKYIIHTGSSRSSKTHSILQITSRHRPRPARRAAVP